MDKIAIPVAIVLAFVGYKLIGDQFKKIQDAQKNAPPVVVQPAAPAIPGPGLKPIPTVQFQPFNPFARRPPVPEPAADDFTPVPFEAHDGLYAVKFPGRKPTSVQFPVFETVVIRHHVPKPETLFEIDDYDCGWDAAGRPGTAREWLKKAHQNQLDGMSAREEATKELTVGDVPGIAFEALYSKDDRVRAWYGKVYLVGSRLVTVSVYGDPNVVAQRAYPFLGSFELTPKAKPVPTRTID
ncbi:unnamed protein product [Gemmataceae bacterium]|nr:unnamed protein product [Gemmataceae bacterium]VTU00187.1 unnamed protein product [Gemmataceae bacterium]